MTQAASGADAISSEVMAAVMAAVQGFLEEESLTFAEPDERLSSWRLAGRGRVRMSTLDTSSSWRGVN